LSLQIQKHRAQITMAAMGPITALVIHALLPLPPPPPELEADGNDVMVGVVAELELPPVLLGGVRVLNVLAAAELDEAERSGT
jgi:hypothetical protein